MAKHIRMNKYAKVRKRLITNSIEGKIDIGGKIIYLDFEVSHDEIDQIPPINWACFNFCMRRDDFDHDFNFKTYYGHIDGLGYIVAEDEIEELNSKDIKKLKRYLKNKHDPQLSEEMLYKQ